MSPSARNWTRRFVGGLAWTCILLSIFPLLWEMTPPWRTNAGASESFSVMRTTRHAIDYSAWGMTYEGRSGYLLRLTQLVCLIFAAVATVSVRSLLRGVGYFLLLAWGALWLANGVRFAWLFPFWAFYAVIGFSLVFLVSVGLRAWMTRRSVLAQS